MQLTRLISCSLILVFCGCSKSFLNVNNNPNAPTTGAAVLLFTNAETQTAATINADLFELNYFVDYTSLEYLLLNTARNNITSADFAAFWTDCYSNLEDYHNVELGSSAGQPFLVAAARTMQALNFQMLVDAYGNIPYRQALELPSGITNPAYDSGSVVYAGCIAGLDSAIAIFESDSVLSAGSYNPGNADVMFQGNVPSWIRLANTLKLRMLLHEINLASQSGFIQSEMAKIAADTYGCIGAGQTASVNPGYATDLSGHLSPLWSSIGYNINGGVSNNEQRATTYMINKLKGYNDPRIAYLYCSNAAGEVLGNPVGDPNNANATYVGSGPGPSATNLNPPPFAISGPSKYGVLQSPTQNAIIVSSWESLFLQAEAAYRGLLPGGTAAAQAFYQQAVTETFTYLNVYTDGNTTGDATSFATAYLAQPIDGVNWTASTNKLQTIITQKYIALCYTNNEESWTDFRRTGYPSDLAVSNDPAVLFPHVLRFIYPQSEYDANADNVAKQGDVSPIAPKIFWMP